MPSLKLDLNDRQHISIILSVTKGNPEEIEVLHGLIQKIQLSKEEKEKIGLQSVGDMITWERSPDDAKQEYDISLQEKKKLGSVLNSWSLYRPSDYEWLPGVLGQL